MAVFHATLVAGLQVDGSAASSETPWPCGPRNCGQFPAWTVTPRASVVNEAATACRSGLMGGPRLSSGGFASYLPASMRIPVSRTSVTSRHPLAVAGGATALILAVLTAAPSATTGPSGAAALARRPLRRDRPADEVVAAIGQPAGENLAWRVPFGSRRRRSSSATASTSTAPPGDMAHPQERLVALDAATGKVVWEQRFPVYLSDVPEHRVGWASPAVDPATGNIYMFGGSAQLCAPRRRTASCSGIARCPRNTAPSRRTAAAPRRRSSMATRSSQHAAPRPGATRPRGGNRYFAFDKKTGQTMWVSSPQTRHYDTNYSTPIVATVNGVALADRRRHRRRLPRAQGEYRRDDLELEVSKRAINSALFMVDNDVSSPHGEENMDTTEMGMIARCRRDEGRAQGGRRQVGRRTASCRRFASPVMDEERRLHRGQRRHRRGVRSRRRQASCGAKLGTLQKGSPVLADGKLYVGTENGKFYILKPSRPASKCSTRRRCAFEYAAPATRVRTRVISRRRSWPTAASTSRRWTRSMPSGRRR